MKKLYGFVYSILPSLVKSLLCRVQASEHGSRFARGALWSIAGAIVSRGLMLLASIFVARMLGQELFGEFGMIRSTVNMFVIFAGFGLGMTATKYVAEFRITDPKRAGQILAISGLFALITGAVVAVGVFVAAPWLANKTINAPQLVSEIRIAAIILFFNALNGAQTGALAGFEAFKTIARVNLGVGLVSFPLLIGGAYLGGLRGAVYALAINMAINWGLNNIALRAESSRASVPFSFQGCTSEWPILLKFSLPAALSGFLVNPVLWGCYAILVNQPGGYAQMGIFDAANQWRTAILFIPAMLGQIVLPMLSSLNGQRDKVNYRKILKCNLFVNCLAALLVAGPVALLAPWIMSSYGAGFEEGRMVLVLLACTSVLMSITTVVGQAIVSKGRVWIGFLFNSGWAITVILLSLFFVRHGYGALGLATSSLLAYLLHSVWQYIYVYKMLKV